MTPSQGDLIWAKYQTEQKTKYYLLLFLGVHEKIVYALDADKVIDEDIVKIKANQEVIREGTLKDIAIWLKQTAPLTYKNAFRQFDGTKLYLVNNYGTTGIQKLT